ncbi:MAG: hypothetical protein K2H64_07415 [Desulfovibrio sp.]|nr:hypothetical protein [Desulfovibrio sp.]
MLKDVLALLDDMENWKKDISESHIFAFTMDIDWASDIATESAVGFFLDRDIPLTVYCTHPSPLLEKYKNNPLVHLGIHPNFLSDSSQGATLQEVVDYLFNLLPDAVTMRCHRWFSDNDIYELLIPRGILFDSNEISMMDVLPPHINRAGILSFPVCWEDGAYLWHNFPLDFGELGLRTFRKPGLKVINCHPMHLALNTPDFKWTRSFKDSLSRERYSSLSREDLDAAAWSGKGIRNFIEDMAEYSAASGATRVLLKDLYDSSPLGAARSRGSRFWRERKTDENASAESSVFTTELD